MGTYTELIKLEKSQQKNKKKGEEEGEIETRVEFLNYMRKLELYWRDKANSRFYKINQQLITLAAIFLGLAFPATAMSDTLSKSQMTLLTLSWWMMMASITMGLLQIINDAAFFKKISLETGAIKQVFQNVEEYTTQKARETTKEPLKQLGGQNAKPRYFWFQAAFFFIGMVIVFLMASLSPPK